MILNLAITPQNDVSPSHNPRTRGEWYESINLHHLYTSCFTYVYFCVYIASRQNNEDSLSLCVSTNIYSRIINLRKYRREQLLPITLRCLPQTSVLQFTTHQYNIKVCNTRFVPPLLASATSNSTNGASYWWQQFASCQWLAKLRTIIRNNVQRARTPYLPCAAASCLDISVILYHWLLWHKDAWYPVHPTGQSLVSLVLRALQSLQNNNFSPTYKLWLHSSWHTTV